MFNEPVEENIEKFRGLAEGLNDSIVEIKDKLKKRLGRKLKIEDYQQLEDEITALMTNPKVKKEYDKCFNEDKVKENTCIFFKFLSS